MHPSAIQNSDSCYLSKSEVFAVVPEERPFQLKPQTLAMDAANMCGNMMPKPDSQTAVLNLSLAFEHYNEYHPHSALGYRSPKEYQRRRKPSA
jgi:transposase InsO family protein